MDDIVLVSGGFDPVHSGHIKLIQEASKYGNVVVLLNSDKWLQKKKGVEFLPFEERATIMMALKNHASPRAAEKIREKLSWWSLKPGQPQTAWKPQRKSD